MSLEILLSCMCTDEMHLLDRINLASNTVIVNQCGFEGYKEYLYNEKNVRVFCSTLTGVTKSRNLAINNATADICLICDDDEILAEGYEIWIKRAFMELPEADVIVFKIGNLHKKYKRNIYKLNYVDLFKVSSVQIAFRRKSIIQNQIAFDEKLGAGSGNGAEEELKFLLDCRRKNLEIYYYPVEIAKLLESDSTWFSGFTYNFFFQRGRTTRYILGYILAELYAVYYLICKYKIYKEDISFVEAFKAMQKGLNSGKLGCK